MPLVLLAVAATLRFYRLGYPDRIYFDETYYAPQGQEYLDRGVEKGFAVHPPVGKWLIASGIAAFGYDAFGWRAAAALAGTVTVVMTYLIGVRLFRRRGVAALAAFLLTVDGLAFTMSRIAMLDVFLALFVTVGVWLVLVDRDTLWAGSDGPRGAPPAGGRPPPRRPRRWRWLAGVAFGLALATKWSALLAIAGAGVFLVVSELAWRRRLTGSPWRAWPRAVGSGLAALVAVPLLVYLASYAGWFANFSETRLGQRECTDGVCDVSAPQVLGVWWREQREIASFHGNLEAEHPYRSLPTTWPLLLRPVAYYYESCNDEKLAKDECVTQQGNVEEILGIGNPAVWWGALVAVPLAGWWAVRRRDWRAATVLGLWLVQYLPWLAVSRPNFLFYMTPVVPFLCLTLAYVAGRLGDREPTRWLPATIAGLAVVGFLFWYPVWVGIEMPTESWKLRMWFGSWI